MLGIRIYAAVAAFGLLAVTTHESVARPIRVAYSGEVASLTYSDCLTYSAIGRCQSWAFSHPTSSDFANGLRVAAADPFNGTFIYDSDAPLTAISSDGYQAVYLNAVSKATYRAGQVALPAGWLPAANVGLNSISVVDGRFGSDVLGLTSVFSGPDWFGIVGMFLIDSTATVFSAFDIPTTLMLSEFTSLQVTSSFLRRSDGDQLRVYGQLTSLDFKMIPEPGSLTLLSFGLAGLGLIRRRRK